MMDFEECLNIDIFIIIFFFGEIEKFCIFELMDDMFYEEVEEFCLVFGIL